MNEKLRPCPFCNGQACQYFNGEGRWGRVIKCVYCGAQHESVQAWNTRHEAEHQKQTHPKPMTSNDAPIGTRAPAIGGGAWYKTERGWKWNGPSGSGGTFPAPGGDWIGEFLLPEQIASKTVPWDLRGGSLLRHIGEEWFYLNHAGVWYAMPPPTARTATVEAMPRFLRDVVAEVGRARSKFPEGRHFIPALSEEHGELSNALLEQEYGKPVTSGMVYKEAVQVAAMAMRIAEEGVVEFPRYQPPARDDICPRCASHRHRGGSGPCPDCALDGEARQPSDQAGAAIPPSLKYAIADRVVTEGRSKSDAYAIADRVVTEGRSKSDAVEDLFDALEDAGYRIVKMERP